MKISFSTYLVVLISFLAGYFEYTFLTILLVLIHELGHFLMGIILKLKVKEINIYFFGGVTLLNEDLNLPIYKEILFLIMGPLLQIFFVLFIKYLYTLGYVNVLTYEKIIIINKFLLTFNLLPILPLDGGKLVNNILDYFLPYKLSHKISIIISIVFIPFIIIINNKLLGIVLTLFLIYKLYIEISNNKHRLNKLLLERKLKVYKFNKVLKIKSLEEVKRNEGFYLE